MVDTLYLFWFLQETLHRSFFFSLLCKCNKYLFQFWIALQYVIFWMFFFIEVMIFWLWLTLTFINAPCIGQHFIRSSRPKVLATFRGSRMPSHCWIVLFGSFTAFHRCQTKYLWQVSTLWVLGWRLYTSLFTSYMEQRKLGYKF